MTKFILKRPFVSQNDKTFFHTFGREISYYDILELRRYQ